jgi:hypothetical protein
MPWLAAAGALFFAILFVMPLYVPTRDPIPSRLAFTGSTLKSVEWVEMCLGKDWGGRLSLRHRGPTKASAPTTRLDNPIRHFVVDLTDEGSLRVLKAYSHTGEPFSRREREALDGCLTGAAFGLADPQRRNGS